MRLWGGLLSREAWLHRNMPVAQTKKLQLKEAERVTRCPMKPGPDPGLEGSSPAPDSYLGQPNSPKMPLSEDQRSSNQNGLSASVFPFGSTLAVAGPQRAPGFLSTLASREGTRAPLLTGRFKKSAWWRAGRREGGREEGRGSGGSCSRKLRSRWLVNCLTFQVLLNTR